MEEKKPVKAKPQNMTLENRAKLVVTGVLDITNFDENTITLDTELGGLTIKGSGLHINKLNVDEGHLYIEGLIHAFMYTEKSESKRTGSFFSSLFK